MDLVQETFREGGLLSKQFKGYSVRPQQVELATKIQQSIRASRPLVGEAPTGVGKSLAALIPAFEVIDQEDAPVVVVTSSIILQEQYYNKDIPLLEKIFERNLNAALIKGRNNYLCPYKLNEFRVGNFQVTTNMNQKEYESILKWADKTKTGDMSELDFVPKHQVWSEFACVDNHECTGKQCPAYDSCHYYNQRRKMMSSKLIICNYHYFLTAIQGENMLPPGVRVVIMDEGHEISAIAKDFQERKYTPNSFKNVMSSFLKVARSLKEPFMVANMTAFVADAQLELLQATITDMFVELGRYFEQKKPRNKDKWPLDKNERVKLQGIVTPHYECLIQTHDIILRYLNEDGLDQEQRSYWHELYSKEEINWQVAIENLFSTIKERIQFLESFCRIASKEIDPFTGEVIEREVVEEPSDLIFWLEPYNDISASMHIKPTSAKRLMAPILNQVHEVENGFVPIIISATLAVNKGFHHIRQDLGMEGPVNELIVTSPFDLTDNLLWYLPQGCPPGNSREHQMYMLDEMLRVIRQLNGRTLCLFTSNKNLTEATNYFRRVLPASIKVLAQGEYPKQKIIDYIKQNPNTVVTATRSFFTGVDIQGQNLSAVLIDKLPFPMIGDPVNDFLMSQERGFWKFTLPETIIALKQGFGRLNRTKDDRGIVGVFDGRLSDSAYKNHIFNSFDFKLSATRDWQTVVDYLQAIKM